MATNRFILKIVLTTAMRSLADIDVAVAATAAVLIRDAAVRVGDAILLRLELLLESLLLRRMRLARDESVIGRVTVGPGVAHDRDPVPGVRENLHTSMQEYD